MDSAGSPDQEPVRARRAPREDAQPQSVIERQGTISTYLLRRAQRRRERFLQRSRTTTIRGELLRAVFLAGCIVVDLLVIPEALFVLPGAIGWVVTAAGFLVAIWLEGTFYADHFALRPAPPGQT